MRKDSRDYWMFWASDVRRAGCELYARLAEGIGDDSDLKDIACLARQGQPPVNLILGAVHFLLLRGADHPLKTFYPSISGPLPDEGDPFPPFREFVLDRRDAVADLVRARVTNTNEVGRSALLHAGFRLLAEMAPAPLHLIEIGASAGLNLNWDRYGVRYVRDGEAVVSVSSDAPLVLDCELRSDRVPPRDQAPKVAKRLGLELNPVDLTDVDDRDWLKALVFPTELERLRRLGLAIELFSRTPQRIRHGDALELLPDALAEAASSNTLCVYHTIVLYQFSREMREAVDDILTVASLRRPLFRLGFEAEGTDYVLSLIRYDDGVRDTRPLGLAHPHGKWLDWRG